MVQTLWLGHRPRRTTRFEGRSPLAGEGLELPRKIREDLLSHLLSAVGGQVPLFFGIMLGLDAVGGGSRAAGGSSHLLMIVGTTLLTILGAVCAYFLHERYT